MDRAELKSEGFEGFASFGELTKRAYVDIPRSPGVYVVLLESDSDPEFLPANPGGRFKGRDPTVDRGVLREKWVQGARIVYIGKADELRRRVRQFAQFGSGKPVGHWGGRYIWQLSRSAELLVAWKTIQEGTARDEEIAILSRFCERYGRSPFANIAS